MNSCHGVTVCIHLLRLSQSRMCAAMPGSVPCPLNVERDSEVYSSTLTNQAVGVILILFSIYYPSPFNMSLTLKHELHHSVCFLGELWKCSSKTVCVGDLSTQIHSERFLENAFSLMDPTLTTQWTLYRRCCDVFLASDIVAHKQLLLGSEAWHWV